MTTPNRLSRPIVLTSATLFVVGVVTGAVAYAQRSDAPAVHHDGTSAWAVHLVLTALAGVAVAVLAARGRLRATLLAPLGRPAAARVRLTLREATRRPAVALRALVAVPFAALFLYGFWRAGEQVVGGLDPRFTADAWGGPSYLGAMYCHYLDGALLMAVAALALHALLLGRGTRLAAVRTSSGVGMVGTR
ncbi:hypothetical protein GCM10025864_37180 [Luteimicrobium album]|uniref:Cytochrome b561 bacterial/Ni-hydrogenase domain-containing protein n=1 Tax=Luteimicrobium album TaxID=1054550 RepID=A0ABQ6I599_9MICO|nr:hypothetical protein [Luteimicrobium album]GMA25959.1 hypothetical protein GCM10025864_37180 [Luteimicrobium album]